MYKLAIKLCVCKVYIVDTRLQTFVFVFISSAPRPVVCQWLQRYEPTTVCSHVSDTSINPFAFDSLLTFNARSWARCSGTVCKQRARESTTTRQRWHFWWVVHSNRHVVTICACKEQTDTKVIYFFEEQNHIKMFYLEGHSIK